MEANKRTRFNNLIALMQQANFDTRDIEKLEQDMEIAEMTGSAFIGNHQKSDEPFLKQAAKDTEYQVYVEPEAFDYLGRRVIGYIGVYTKDIYKDHGKFWDRFKELRGH